MCESAEPAGTGVSRLLDIRDTGVALGESVDLAVVKGVIVHPGAKTLAFDAGDGVSVTLAAYQGRRACVLRTKGDGACAVHAVFGSGNEVEQQLAHDTPRGLLRELFNLSPVCVYASVRPHMRGLTDTVFTSLCLSFRTWTQGNLHQQHLTRNLCF